MTAIDPTAPPLVPARQETVAAPPASAPKPAAPAPSLLPPGITSAPVAASAPPPPGEGWPTPTFVVQVDDALHLGAVRFFAQVDVPDLLRTALAAVLEGLYTPLDVPRGVQQIRFVLRPMPGVAYTTGSATHKEIHLSLEHVANSQARAGAEVRGVFTHELVHCFQYDAGGTAPGGLIEGIADWIRLRADLAPPHWRRTGGDKWDAGYQTTGYFLDWVEERYGSGTVAALNGALRDGPYDEAIFKHATGRPVRKLWSLYCKWLEDGDDGRAKPV